MKLKICGMRDPMNIRQVVGLEPDYMGFIFYHGSPRFVGENFSPPPLPSSIKKVGVFVNATVGEMRAACSEYTLDYLQLHGNESWEMCRELRGSGLRVIKAFAVDSNFDFTITKNYQQFVDYFLFDTKGKLFGGNASAFDWSILANYDQSKPFFLSGGLNEHNMVNLSALSGMNLHALDINSGVETAPGVKDVNKIKNVKDVLKSMV